MQKESVTFMSTVLKEDLYSFIEKIKKNYSKLIRKNRFIVLKTDQQQYSDYFFVFYQIQNTTQRQLQKIKNTTMINKKGTCFFTVNALNKIIEKQYGEKNPQYMVDWTKDDYKDKIFFTNNNQLVEIDTIFHTIKY